MKMKTFGKIAGVLMAAAVAFSGNAMAEGRGDLAFGCSVQTLDAAENVNNWLCLRIAVGETLFRFNDNFETVPYLLDDYSIADDHLTWTFKIKEGIKFHNGKEMDAEAVKASLERLVGMNEVAAADLAIDTIEADGYTLTLKTKEPIPTLPNNLARPQTVIVDADADVDFMRYPVCTGAYKVADYADDEYIKLEAFEDYWQGTPGLDTVTIRSTGDLDSLALALQNGELDAAYGLSYDLKSQFDDDPGFKITDAATSRVYMCYFNYESPAMQDEALRKAVCLATDKVGYAIALINGAGTPTKATFPTYTAFGNDEDMTAVPEYNMEEAAQVLADAGYADNDGDGFLEKDGEKICLKVVTYGRTGLPQSGQALVSSLQQLGLETAYEQVDSIDDYLASNTWDISPYAYVTMPTGDPYAYIYATMATDGYSNFGHYSNPEVDALIEELSHAFDVDERAALATKIQQMVTEDFGFSYMFHLNMYMPMKDCVENIVQNPSDYYYINWNTTKAE